MEITPESKEQIKSVKEKQRGIIIECDKAINDIQENIKVLQEVLGVQQTNKKCAQDTLDGLDKDFPDVIEVGIDLVKEGI